MVWRIVFALVTIAHLGLSVEREMTVHVDPGKEECFFESVPASNTLTVEYQVIDGGSGQMAELDINFRIVNPKGQPIFAEFKKPDGSHTYKSEVSVDTNSSFESLLFFQEIGDYKICFDNKFSYLSSKTVYFEIFNINEEEEYDDLAGIFDDEELPEEYYDVQVSDIEVRVGWG